MTGPAVSIQGVLGSLAFYGAAIFLLIAVMGLLKGPGASELRTRLAVFHVSVVTGLYLCTTWFMLNLRLEGESFVVSPSGLWLTGPVLRRIVPLFLALSVHEFVYIAGGLRALCRDRRNALAAVVLAASCLLAYGSLVPHARFWRGLYGPDALARSRAIHARAASETDARTAQWAREHPASWQFRLLRANALQDQAGKAARVWSGGGPPAFLPRRRTCRKVPRPETGRLGTRALKALCLAIIPAILSVELHTAWRDMVYSGVILPQIVRHWSSTNHATVLQLVHRR